MHAYQPATLINSTQLASAASFLASLSNQPPAEMELSPNLDQPKIPSDTTATLLQTEGRGRTQAASTQKDETTYNTGEDMASADSARAAKAATSCMCKATASKHAYCSYSITVS